MGTSGKERTDRKYGVGIDLTGKRQAVLVNLGSTPISLVLVTDIYVVLTDFLFGLALSRPSGRVPIDKTRVEWRFQFRPGRLGYFGLGSFMIASLISPTGHKNEFE